MSCTQFKQQRLPAWQPLLSPVYVSVLFAVVAFIFVPVGVVISSLNGKADDFTFRYDHISKCTASSNHGAFSYTGNGQTLRTGCVTEVKVVLPKDLKAPIFLYYGLTGFYQNHRRFSNSKSDAQLAGEDASFHVRHLAPLAVPGDLQRTTDEAIVLNGVAMRYHDCVYAPAGLIPWAMFNDSFSLFTSTADGRADELICDGSAFSRATNEPLASARTPRGKGCHKKGIAWETDVVAKYRPLFFAPDEIKERHVLWSAPREMYKGDSSRYPNPPTVQSNDSCFNEGWYAHELGHAIPVTTDEDLMVWSRVASMPTFRKLYRVIDEDLKAGTYIMKIDEHYDVSSFKGEKSFTLATLSWIGGKNPFLANLYIVTGAFSAVSAVVLTGLRKHYRDRAAVSVALLIAE